MLYNILDVAEKTRSADPGEATLYALLGFAVVFLGIAFLIFVVWLVGKIMTKFEGLQKTKKQKKQVEKTQEDTLPEKEDSDAQEIDEEIVAVITAAIMAYYQKSNPKCEFTVKRIKRI